MIQIIVLTIVAGLLGGVGNLLLDVSAIVKTRDNRLTFVLTICASLLLGVVAAGLVPLFLSMSKSELIRSAMGTDPPANIDKLVYFGFCLVAAVTSRRFIDNVAERAFKLASAANERTEATEKDIKEITAKFEEPPVGHAANRVNVANQNEPLEMTTLRAIVANPTYTRRSVEGISEDVKKTVPEVQATLDVLVAKGLVDTVMSQDGRTLYRASKKGLAETRK
jgi:hypothetical protein